MNEILSKLKSIKVKRYPLNDYNINLLKDFISIFSNLSKSERENIVDSIDIGLSSVLLEISKSCAEKAIDSKNEKWIKIALIARSIENFRNDYQENIISLSLINYANNLVSKKTFRELIQEIRPLINYKAFKVLTQFQINQGNNISLNSYGMKVIMRDGKTRFVREGYSGRID